jgi:hypothetical protein
MWAVENGVNLEMAKMGLICQMKPIPGSVSSNLTGSNNYYFVDAVDLSLSN